jgi:alpha-D-ribose 1-methylphosphonate 5-triphosphate diphosphatase
VTRLSIRGGQTLLSDTDSLESVDLLVEGGAIVAIDGPDTAADGSRVVDASGALVLPGVIDVHGDAFERAVMPRGGVAIDVAAGLADNNPQLLAAGITTAYLSITDSWEPGLRSRSMLRELLDANDRVAGGPDRLIHVRHERCNTDDFDELLGWIEQGRIRMVSYNDHTPGGIATVKGISPPSVARSGISSDALERRQNDAVARRPLGRRQDERLAEVCRSVGCVTASHDAGDLSDLERDLALGVEIAEFPFTIELAREYLDRGIDVLLGAPNLVRGESHLGNLSVRDAIVAEAGTLLCSDYHYPSLLRAPFTLVEEGICSLAAAWGFVSGGPARAARLTDRGRLEIGARADVIVVEPPTADQGPRVRAAVVGGLLVYEVAPG